MDEVKFGEILLPGDEDTQSRREKTVRQKFWPTFRRAVRQIPFSRDVIAGFYCALDPQTPTKVRGVLLAALAYFVMSPVAEHLALIKEILPDVKTIGYLYNSGEANSVSLLAVLKAEAEKAGLKVVESAATKSAEVQGAARALVGRADAIYIPTDNTIISALEGAVAVAAESKLPLFTADTDSVSRGSVAALGFNYYDVGKQTGEIVVRVLKGENPGDIAVKTAAGSDLVVNKAAAAKMGVTLPESVLSRANKVIE